MCLIEIKNVVKNFGVTQVIKDVSISIKEGEIYGIIGHSGAGKSTLLRCINGLESYDGGSINVMGKEVSSLEGKSLREFRKDLGMIFQNFNLMQRKNVFAEKIVPNSWDYLKPMSKKEVDKTIAVRFHIQEASAKVRQGPPSHEEDEKDLPIWTGLIPIKPLRQKPIPDEEGKRWELPEHLVGL